MSEVPRAHALPVGKLPAAELEAALARYDARDPRLLVGPRVGEDAAVIAMDDRRLVVATDPITFAIDRIGWYAVHVNANDVAVLGARPLWFFVVMAPLRRATQHPTWPRRSWPCRLVFAVAITVGQFILRSVRLIPAHANLDGHMPNTVLYIPS